MIKLKQSLLLLLLTLGLAGCKKDPPVGPPITVDRTVFVYMPWSSNLLPYFRTNLDDLKASIVEHRIRTDRFVVFLSETSSTARMFELKYENGKVKEIPLKEYKSPAFTTASGIASILNDMKSNAPAPAYSMIIGSHGVGWIPVPTAARQRSSADMRMHWEGDGPLLTRYFGGFDAAFQTDITTLADGIEGAGLTMDYILFDDCYMGNVETAYDLKDVTDHLIGCPTEVMAYGFPYRLVGKHLTGTVNYEGVVDGFYAFYSSYSSPYGTISVTDCSHLEALAGAMREINRDFTFDPAELDAVQRMDGYSPVMFYDLGDYAAKMCGNSTLLTQFERQLERTVPFKAHTPKFYSALSGRDYGIDAYSGLTVSDPSTNSMTAAKGQTAWWIATH